MILRPKQDGYTGGQYHTGVSRRYSSRMAGLSGPAGASSCAQYIDNAYNAMPPVATAAMLLNTPSPADSVLAALYINSLPSSPAATAQAVVTQLAQEYCGAVADEILSGDPNAASNADCLDGGAACAAAAYPKWLAYYSALPSSVWTSGTVSPQQANPQVFAPVTPNQPMTPAVAPASPLPSPTPTPHPAPVAQPSTSVAANTQGNVLNPPSGGQALPTGTLVQNQSGSGTPVGAGNTSGSGTGTGTTYTPSTPFIVTWLQSNWYVAAAAGVGLLLLMKD